jgi:16S rRNA (cytosine1407-C5)-methyltransferase
MLPVELLDPQPGETVLDMSSAPGSKTTQIAAKMRGRGVIIANDVQEKRLWTLKSALHRCGVVNDIVTKKVGQWFARHMTERFDRVLCDAPCTAQGTTRKDSDALQYCSLENIGKMARLQRELLEAAIHATKVGGTVVYSTCTLTPEENEEVVASILHKFSAQVKPLEPGPHLKQGLEDSRRVQKAQGLVPFPAVRLWPHTLDTEGFFVCALQKVAPTRQRERMDFIRFQEDQLPSSRQREFGKLLLEEYGQTFLEPHERLMERSDMLILTNEDVENFSLPVQDYALGLPFARRLEHAHTSGKEQRIRLDHDIATLRGERATMNVCELSQQMLDELLEGKDTHCDAVLRGDVILLYRGMPVGFGLAKDGHLKNRLPRWIVQKS